MYNIYDNFTVPNCWQNCKVWRCQIKQQRKGGISNRHSGKIDQFWKDLVRRIVYGFYRRKLAPTLHMLLHELKSQ